MKEHLKKISVSENSSIKEVMKIINNTGKSIALIVGKNEKLFGIVTDGDIRRAILNGKSISGPIKDIMNKSPTTVLEGTQISEILNIINTKNVAGKVPIVDKKGKIVDLAFLSDIKKQDILFLQKDKIKKHLKLNKILVIGGAGFIGSILVRKLLDKGYNVRVFDTLLYGKDSIKQLFSIKNFEFVEGDTRHIESLVSALQDVDAVVHLAEIVGDPACALDTKNTHEINYFATEAIASICKYLQINRFVYMSSCSVYGASKDSDTLLTEESPLNPVSLYAKLKIESENAILSIADENFRPTILRLSTVYGLSFRPRFDLVVNTFIAKASKGEPITIFGGDQWRPNIHVSDVASAIILVLESPIEKSGNQIFNVGSDDQNFTITKIGEMINSLIPNSKIEINNKEVDKRNYRVCFDKIKSELGYKISKTIKDAVFEIKEQFDSGKIKDYKERKYNNYKYLNE